MKIFSLFLFLSGCSTDVSIMKRNDDSQQDTNTSAPVQDQLDSSSNTNDLDSDSNSSTDMSDLTVGYGELHFRQIACPACVGASGEFDITAELKLHYPTSGDYTEYLQPVGSCTTNLIETHVSSQPLQSTQQALFNGITLNPDGQGRWTNGFIYEYQYERNSSYSVTSEHGTIQDAFTSIEGFDDIQPYTLLWVDPSYAFEPVISKSGTSFSWFPVVNNSQFEIIIAVYSPDGSQFLGAVSCLEEDTGTMYIPGNYFQSYPYWSLAAVHFIRHRIDKRPAPELNGYFQSHMMWEVVGTGHIE